MRTQLKLTKTELLNYLSERVRAKGKQVTPNKLMIESLFCHLGTVLDTDKEVIQFCKEVN